MTDWAQEYLAASQVSDMGRSPDDYRVTRQSKVTIGGLLVPVSEDDGPRLENLFLSYEGAFRTYREGLNDVSAFHTLTATMRKIIERSAIRARFEDEALLAFEWISIDPRDYTTFSAPDIGDLTVVSIHTRPERCWFLGILKFEGALGLSLGRMRVMRPTDKGMYPVTIRTKWRALTNSLKQKEVRDAYQRLIEPS